MFQQLCQLYHDYKCCEKAPNKMPELMRLYLYV